MRLLDDEYSKREFLHSLSRARAELGFELWAYVMMPEHVHLLIYPGDEGASVATILEAIQRPASVAILREWRTTMPELAEQLKVKRSGAKTAYRFWQPGGGYDRNRFTEEAIIASIEYIHNNPVRRQLVQASTDWPWCSAGQYLDKPSEGIQVDRYSPTTVASYGGSGLARQGRRRVDGR